MSDQANATAAIVDSVVQSEIQAQETNRASIKEKITEIKADAELLKHLTVEFDVNGAVQSAEELRKQIQAQLANNPLMIFTVVASEGQNVEKAELKKYLNPKRKLGVVLYLGLTRRRAIQF